MSVFTSSGSVTRGGELPTIIGFPLRGLDLGKYVRDKTTSHVYELSAVYDHYGNMNEGHYKARAKVGDTFFFSPLNISISVFF